MLSPEEAEQLQRKYAARRKRWARSIGIPYGDEIAEPDPGALPIDDPEEG